MFRVAILLVLASLVTACGFQLRGVGGTNVPDDWKLLHLDTGNPNSEFARQVNGQFAANGVVWSEAADANYTLVLGPEKFQQRNLSLNAEARVSEIELTMTAEFEVVDAESGAEIMPPTKTSVIKQMENNPRNVMGKESEMRILQSEMRTELAQQIMRRIAFYAAYIEPGASQP